MKTKNTIKISIGLTVEVDLDAYRLAYGEDPKDVVRDHFRYAVLDAAGPEGGIFAPDSGIVSAKLTGNSAR